MLPFTLDDLIENFNARYLERGEQYQRQNKVTTLSLNRGNHVVSGIVSGNSRRPYKTHTIINDLPRAGAEITGNCTCPVGYNCKHVAATLLEALARHGQAPSEPRGAGAARPRKTHHPVDEWLQQLEQALNPALRNGYPANINQRLLYILNVHDYQHNSKLEITPQMVRALKSGGYGKATPYNPSSMSNYGAPAYFLAIDENIVNRLHTDAMLNSVSHTANQLSGKNGAELLRDMLETGRCHWQDKDQPPLSLGDSRPAKLEWHSDNQGNQRPALQITPEATRVLPVSPPWYLDLPNQQCGPLRLDLPTEIVETLLAAPTIAAEQAEYVHQQLSALSKPVPLPQTLRIEKGKGVDPVPVLHLGTDIFNIAYDHWDPPEHVKLASTRLSFDYNGATIDAGAPDDSVRHQQGETLIAIKRRQAKEKNAIKQLTSLGFSTISDLYYTSGDITAKSSYIPVSELEYDDEPWLDFMIQGLPQLRAAGWRIDIDDDFPYRLAEIGQWYMDLDDQPHNPWFDLELGVEVDGEKLNLLPMLVEFIQQSPQSFESQWLAQLPDDHAFLVHLSNSKILTLPASRVRGILSVLLELYDHTSLDRDGRVRLPELRAPELAELENIDDAAGLRWTGGDRLKSLGERLRNFTGIATTEPPKDFNATLRNYQQDGLNWLQFLREYQFGGILADDMGLGKTVQTLAHLATEKAAGRADLPSLVVAPTSLMVNWRREAAQFTPNLNVLTLHGPQRKRDFHRIADHDLVLTTYPLLARDQAALLEQNYHLLILDEAQNIKNPKSKATLVTHQINARHRLCLSGTPMENNLGELWSIMHLLMPGLLGDERQFRRLFRTPIEKHSDGERQARLAKRIAPFMLRRTKEAVATELPPKTEIARGVILEGSQRDLYETIRVAMEEKVRRAIDNKGMNRSRIVILDALLKLRQVCCDPRLLKMDAAKKVKHSAKLDTLMAMIPELVEEGRRILLFSQFTTMLGLIEKELASLKLPYVKLTGQTRDRATPINRFQDGEIPLFLISLKAGGTGLNLTAADTVIHYDPWWNPAVEQQATDRAHRIGQDKPVFVYKLISEGTVEERIADMQARKRALAEGLFSESGNASNTLRPEDLSDLFKPLT